MNSPSPRYSYCKLYVSSHDSNAIMTLLTSELDATTSGDFATVDGLTFDVMRNSDADDTRADDFIFWPIIVNVNNERGQDHEIVQKLSTLLQSAWANSLAIVAACPFEDELPWSGGIGRL